jgi:hypothetical protein
MKRIYQLMVALPVIISFLIVGDEYGLKYALQILGIFSSILLAAYGINKLKEY